MYSKDFDRSFCSESGILRGPVGSMDTDRAVLNEVCWRPEGEYIGPEFVGGEVQFKNERECRDKDCLQLKTVGGRAHPQSRSRIPSPEMFAPFVTVALLVGYHREQSN